MQGARSLSVDSAWVGLNSCCSNRPRHANRHGFLPLLLRCRDGKPSALKSQKTTNLQTQKVGLLSALFYSKESLIPFENWELWKKLHHEQASIEGSLAPRLGNRDQGKSQHSPSRIARNAAKACAALAFPSPAESSAIGNTQRYNAGTHKEHHNFQAEALLRRLDDSQTRCRKSPQFGRRTTTHCTKIQKHSGSSRKMSGTQPHKLCTQLHVYRRSRFQSFELLLQLSQLFLLRLVVATV